MSILLGAVSNKRSLRAKMHTYILMSSFDEGKLLPMMDLYGDGSRWENDKNLFKSIYNIVKSYYKKGGFLY
jgi:hypothetical protein